MKMLLREINLKLSLYGLITAFLLPSFGVYAAGPAVIPDEIRQVMKRYKVPLTGVSIVVKEVGAGNSLLSVAADKPRNPASTIKLLTTWAALEGLGPAWTWSTEAYVDGLVEDGTLRGDLILKGYGDPYFITERMWGFQRQLRARGIKNIEGNLGIDNSYFLLEPSDTSEFDGEGLRAYNVLPDAMLVNFQTIHMTFRPDFVNNNVQLLADPVPTNLKIENQLKLGQGFCGGYQNGISVTAKNDRVRDQLVISGKFGRDCNEYSMSRSALTAPTFAYGVFRSLWEESGGHLSGALADIKVPADVEPFYSTESPPLADVITYINKFSNNVMARQLFLTLGAEIDSLPGTLQKSRKAVRLLLKQKGLEFSEMLLDNGSGLSRKTRISSAHLGAVLQQASSSAWSAEFISSMSLPGLDGTLRKRFTHEAATGRMHLKTGRLSNVYATAGFVHANSGREFIVVILQNYKGADDGPGEEVQAALLRWVYQQ
ncbi:MAG: D-alanyl-D-alanine carboxypeptidase/D-alanyl-D-alanine-endopeptidase [Gammaproteobacteria bacterium]|nr:D-alanyl-D-alanine carboxypeptidase/D-alanyl-D-alanine-endopeptidase [Gammaproteobacteria bacterium]MCP4089047.1 D-alanyl-D-alanine carboxypeptidase/D-alanyl-D-alanine-endopeptidase [Gammaproteobacteria bacterium]MCP4278053.1 D-alanyl-D-alanine carboxypeptidase/D-alanyl-D-alanine-endopeptidase [Gammaproteobacteria bacterium]MCP4833029.1 D-alanyl-D-alanine carboxypeptidase/D-alanyl-D-alanine-endopeptidase [Gammaproteobacteria bacterium]MCP4929270.1 D-alanyl-D-alanine carboxypeptidase/D-alanyl